MKVLRVTVVVLALAVLLYAGAVWLPWQQQAIAAAVLVLAALWMDRASPSYLVTLTLMAASIYATYRYAWWRVRSVLVFLREPAMHRNWADAIIVILLLLAETYAFAVLFLGYAQTAWPLRRSPVPLPDDTDEWPAVDLLIPTFNEPLSVVRYTALAATLIDWPIDKLNVYLLDDGDREEFRLFAEDAGIGYVTRGDNLHAKAGNINAALVGMRAPLVAIFDSDHVPTRSFLQIIVGWFLRDARLGMLQTPHHLYSPDPFERNLRHTLDSDAKRRVPSESELFYGVVQDGNDFWNAAFFCGSCAVLRRSALDAVGGMAVETVTEDAHTSLRMQKAGWNTAYINIPQAAGLATERLSDYVRQRTRWARGMVQILRTENPLFARGLSAMQRLCYFNAMVHFLYGLPRLIFLLAPLTYLLFGRTSMPGYWAAVLAYALPHLALSVVTASRMHGQHRHSFWNEIYETVMAPYIVLPTLMALLRPTRGAFNVTAKGSVVYRRYFNSRIALPYLLLLGVNLLAVLSAIPRLFPFPFRLHGVWLGWLAGLYQPSQRGPVAMNLAWVVFNAVILGVACGVASESQQRRRAVRVTMQVPAVVVLPDGSKLTCVTCDVSSGGVMLSMDRRAGLRAGDPVRIQFSVLDAEASLPATIVHADGVDLRAQFAALSIPEEDTLTQVLYSRADTWLRWSETSSGDRPLRSLWHIARLSARGMKQTMAGMLRGDGNESRKLDGAIVIALLLLVAAAACLSSLAPSVRAGQGKAPARAIAGTHAVPLISSVPSALPEEHAAITEAGDFSSTLTLAELTGSAEPMMLREAGSARAVPFAIPTQQVVRSARLRLRYRVSSGLLPGLSDLKVHLNGTLIDTIPLLAPVEDGASQEAAFDLPAEMLVRGNVLTVEFAGHSSLSCDDPANIAVWAALDGSSSLELTGTRLAIDDDLKLLPAPFFEPGASIQPVIPLVLLQTPSPAAMQAAGVVASYLGSLAGDRQVRFPVSIGEIPQGNAIVVSERAADLPEGLRLDSVTGATLAVRTNPGDPYAKVLIVTGTSGAETVQAAQALALGRGQWQGSQAAVTVTHPPKSAPDDAPRWLRTDAVTHFSDLVAANELEGPGPINIPLGLPPDLYYGDRATVPLHLAYRYDAAAASAASALRVSVNGTAVSSIPTPHVDGESTRLEAEVSLPRGYLRPFRQTLGFDFGPRGARGPGCSGASAAAGSDDGRGAGFIMGTSYVDLRGLPHRTEMPDLALFAQAGFPFTRWKDLSGTLVVLPDAPDASEMELFLSLIGQFGAATGYPALDVTVAGPQGMRAGSGGDTLVLGTVEDQPALRALGDALPVQLSRGGWSVTRRDGWAGTWDTLRSRWEHWRQAGPVLETRGGLPDAVIEGAEWPRGSKRSVVVIALRDAAVVPGFLSAFQRDAPVNGTIAESVSVLRGGRFESYRMGDRAYAVGSLPRQMRLQMLWAVWPAVMVLLVLVACVVLAAVTRVSLRKRARLRLHPAEE